MTIPIIITLCTLLLIAYLFDITSRWTKIPSVLLLLLLGWVAHQVFQLAKLEIPDLSRVLPILGVIGLIMIVLDGSLELEFNRSKQQVIKRSFYVSFFPMMLLAFILAALFHYFGTASYRDSLANAIPFCVISSAIAISSAKNFDIEKREFITYESSMSDIIGVLFFNFIALNEIINVTSIGIFLFQIFIITIISFIATIALAFLLGKIEHQIKFAPVILLIILIYAVAEVYHLPALMFIVLFGLFLGNLKELKKNRWMYTLRPQELSKEVHKLKEITAEATFLIRSLFFLLFGYLMQTNEILNPNSFTWATLIVLLIFILRAIQLRVLKMPLMPLVFMAPRGLVNILLFLAISPARKILLVNTSLMIQVIILSSLIMMAGMMATKNKLLISRT